MVVSGLARKISQEHNYPDPRREPERARSQWHVPNKGPLYQLYCPTGYKARAQLVRAASGEQRGQ